MEDKLTKIIELWEKQKKKIIGAGCALALTAGLFTGIPMIKTAYKRYKANDVLKDTEEKRVNLSSKISEAERFLKNNKFLMTGEEEIRPYEIEITHAGENLSLVENTLDAAKKDLAGERYDSVRKVLDEKFDSEQNIETPRLIASKEIDLLNQKVIAPINKRRTLRDSAVSNEWYLKARLKSPIRKDVEKEDELGKIPQEFYEMIPVKSDIFDAEIRKFNPEAGFGNIDKRIYNSLGSMLIKGKHDLDHILKFSKSERAKTEAEKMFSNAFGSYIVVREMNDKLIWYRDREHDGKFSLNDHQTLVEGQNKAIDKIHYGDNSISDIKNLLDELHQQKYIFVTDQNKRSTSFLHTRLKTRSVTRTDSKGNTHFDTETYPELYHTDGYKFYYTLQTVTPQGSTDEEVYVGEKDSEYNFFYSTWDYNQPQESVGFVREWKRLHHLKSEKVSGWVKEIRPKIEPMSESCKAH